MFLVEDFLLTVANGKTVIAYAKADDGTNPNIVQRSLALMLQ